MAQRRASATWQGDLFEGGGVVSALSSGLFTDAGVTWAARTEDSGGRTSPEELIAAAHAACFCMALSNELSSRGHVPSKLQVEAICTFEGGKVTMMALDVSATVPGADEAAFREGLEAAEGSCPVSNALRNNVPITVDGRLV
ncbi:MAG TPA: OsmC family peroxiredoxin [Acidimicrobiales bacterium]|nr:OsmC family peroxiredoxin [Acidimicrobiales bacterium]